MYKNAVIFSLVIVLMAGLSCSRSINSGSNQSDNKNQEEKMSEGQKVAGPPVYIYKTRNDYYDKVPVTLSDDQSGIVSYPDIRDVYKGGEPAYPTKLEGGFLLDNRGIDQNTAFLSVTYEEYAALPKTPDAQKNY